MRFRRGGNGARAGVLLVAALAGAGTPSAAQDRTLLSAAYAGQPREQQVEVELTPVLASHGRQGPVGWVTCRVHNPDQRAHEVSIALTTFAQRVRVQDRLTLAPGERALRHYPAFRSRQFPSVVVHTDSGPGARSNVLGAGKSSVSLLLITSRPGAASVLEGDLARRDIVVERTPGRRATRSSATPIDVVAVRSDDLPDTWTCLAGFDAVLVDGRSVPSLAGQQALLDLVATGGVVLVAAWQGLSPGPLRAACAGEAAGFGRGRLLPATADPEGVLDTEAGAVLATVCVAAAARQTSGPVADAMDERLRIPGLGRAPVVAFFALLALFVVLAGPVNWFLCRRARRPLLFAVTLPLLGFGFTGAILAWGILAEGLGVRGTVRSVTWLDQRQHVGASQAGMSLFAGLTPDALVPAPGTLTYTSAIADDWSARTPHRFLLDVADGGKLDGSLLPARYETHVVTASCRRVRERLRFRRLGDGSLEVLCGPGLVPAAPGVVVCDHTGKLWSGSPSGERTVLQPCAADAARQFVSAAAERFNAHELMASVDGRPRRRPDGAWTSDVDLPVRITPGSYVAWASENAAVDSLGLQVDWEDARHLVFGLLAAEDFVD
ncbi:MAG: hypothetical protein R3F56_09860 [Planctomycetota bacterium]